MLLFKAHIIIWKMLFRKKGLRLTFELLDVTIFRKNTILREFVQIYYNLKTYITSTEVKKDRELKYSQIQFKFELIITNI